MGRALMKPVEALLQSVSIVFWDFDGVIKDSVRVKSLAFEHLFLPYGRNIAARTVQHHEAHSGISRYEKIPIYLRWAGEPAGPDQIQDFCQRFSQLVRQAVIDAAWVPGVREYLHAYHARQRFVLVTATPQEEIQQILHALALARCFREVHGAPTPKATAIRDVLLRQKCPPEQALVVGDSESDLEAAKENQLDCLLRRSPLNQDLQERHRGLSFDGLNPAISL